MGEAKRRKAEIEKLKNATADWYTTLSQSELQAAKIAELAYARIVEDQRLTGGCYLLAFFLCKYMRARGLNAEAIVGWVNDGTSEIMASHAWVEMGGKKIDISLTRTDDEEVQPPGPLLILDRVFRPGRVTYTYHRQQSPESLHEVAKLRDSAPAYVIQAINQKMSEHLKMEATAKQASLIEAYLEAAPRNRNYDALAKMLA